MSQDETKNGLSRRQLLGTTAARGCGTGAAGVAGGVSLKDAA